jgi:hypothetical protein
MLLTQTGLPALYRRIEFYDGRMKGSGPKQRAE